MITCDTAIPLLYILPLNRGTIVSCHIAVNRKYKPSNQHFFAPMIGGPRVSSFCMCACTLLDEFNFVQPFSSLILCLTCRICEEHSTN